MSEVPDDRKLWEKKAQRMVKWIGGAVAVGAIVLVGVLDVEPRTERIVYGALLALTAFASMAIRSFPGSTGFLRQPISPFPRFAIGFGLMVTGAGIALVGTGHALAVLTMLFGPLFIAVGAGEFWRRGHLGRKEAAA